MENVEKKKIIAELNEMFEAKKEWASKILADIDDELESLADTFCERCCSFSKDGKCKCVREVIIDGSDATDLLFEEKCERCKTVVKAFINMGFIDFRQVEQAK